MSEIYFLAFSTWTVFFLLRSGNLSNRKMTCTAGIFLGLAACTRPVEVPLNLGILLALFAGVLYRKKQLRLGRVLEFAFFSLILPVLWFAPKFQELKYWILDSTAGPDLPRAGISFLRSASFQLGAPVMILLLSWVLLFARDRVPRPYKWALACFGANWVGGLLAGSLTKNGDFRYYEFSTVLLTGWLLVCCLGSSSDWRARIARAGILGVALLQLYHLGTYVFGAQNSRSRNPTHHGTRCQSAEPKAIQSKARLKTRSNGNRPFLVSEPGHRHATSSLRNRRGPHLYGRGTRSRANNKTQAQK